MYIMIPDRQLSSQNALRRGSLFCHLRTQTKEARTHLTVLEVVEEDVQALGLNTVVLDDDARAADDLARVAFTVDLAETSPRAEDLGVTNLDEVDLVFSTEGLDELDVLGFRAGLNEDAQVRLAFVKRLRTLTKTTSETIMDEGVLQDLLYVGSGYENSEECRRERDKCT